MRCMEINKIPFYYALYQGYVPLIDEQGFDTGEQVLSYSNPIKTAANISAAKGNAATREFGDDEDYNRVITLENNDTPIDEFSRLWVERVPVIKEDGSTDTPHDYTVRRVARSLNGAQIAIRKVDVR